MTNDVKSFNNHTESGPTSIGNTCVSHIPFSSECLPVINKVVNDPSLPDNTFKFHSITNANEPSLVHANDRSSHNPFPIESITTMKLSSLASINEDRGPSTSENIRNNSPNTVKPNTVNQPSNKSNPFHSPFHPLSSSDANGILEQTINAPTDRTTLDLTSEIPKKTPTVVKGGITISKEERSQRYSRSRSRSKSLQKTALSSQQIQKKTHQQQQRFHDILKEPSSPFKTNNNTSSKRNNNDRRRNTSRSTSPTRRTPINFIPARSSSTTHNRGRSRSSSSNSPSSIKRTSRSPITNIVKNTRPNYKSKARTSRSTPHSCSRSCLFQSRPTSRSTNHRSVNNHRHNRRQPHHLRPRPKSPSHSRSPVLSPHHHPLPIHPPNDFKEIRSNSQLRIRHYNPHSSPLI